MSTWLQRYSVWSDRCEQDCLGHWVRQLEAHAALDARDARIRELEEAVKRLGAGVIAMKSYLQSDPRPARPGIGDIINAIDAINDNPIAAEACKEPNQ